MSIINKPDLPGSQALAQRVPKVAGTGSVYAVNVLAGTPDALANGNLAVGRSGQLGIVDRFDVFGVASSAVASAAYLRDSDYDNDATTGSTSIMLDLPFGMQAFNLTTNIRRWQRHAIEKFGYVLRSDDTRVDDPGGSPNLAINGYIQYPRKLSLFQTSASQLYELDAYLKMRYIEKGSAERNGVVRGAWSGTANSLGSSFAMLAAPGTGLHYRIRTLILIGCGGSTVSHRMTIGTNATPSNAPVFECYSSPAEDGYAVQFLGTDLDIPCPENTPIYWAWDSGFNARATLVIGCEVAPVALSNHLNLTGIPQ